MSDELKPCPYCGSSLNHVESLARSLDPPRVYHEYHHPKNGCFMVTGNRHAIVANFTDDPTPRLQFIDTWNRRATPTLGPQTKAVLAEIVELLTDPKVGPLDDGVNHVMVDVDRVPLLREQGVQ